MLTCTFCGRHESQTLEISRVTYVNGREAHFCLDCFVTAAVDSGAVLLLGPAAVGKSYFCKSFARMALEAGRPVVYFPSDQTADDLRQEMHQVFLRNYGEAAHSEEDNDLRIIDYYSTLMGREPQTKYALSSLSNLTDLSITLRTAWEGLLKSCMILDDLSVLAQEAGADVTLKFLRQLVAKLRGIDALGIFSMTTGMLDDRFQNSALTMFDGVLEMKIQDEPEGLERYIRIYSLRGQKHSTKWTRFEITEQGIAILPAA